jgi:choline dehydrogenase-like flavoprotein
VTCVWDDGVVVIGAGPSAAVAARELVKAGLPVTMLDAGHGEPRGILVHVAGRTVLRWTQRGYLFTDRQRSAGHRPVTWISSLSHGGLTNFWTGVVPRYAPEDFTEGAIVDERFAWPIGYDDLVEFYDMVEQDLMITAGDRAIPNVPQGRVAHRYQPPRDWRELAQRLEVNGATIAPAPMAGGSRWMIALRPREFTSQACIIRRFATASNFRLRRSARVVRLKLAKSADRVESAVYVDGTGQLRSVRGRAFVVAAGTLDSTEILLRSVSPDFPSGLGNSYGLLGSYLHDHPREWWPARPRRPLTAVPHPMYIAREPYGSSEPLSAASMTMGIGSMTARLATFVNRRTDQLGVQVLGTMIPSDKRSVSLTPGWAADDPASQLHLDHSFDDQALRTLYRARSRFRQLFADAGNPIEIGPFHEIVPGSAVHYAGSARMHHRPEFGVVDAFNRVHAVPNVVVCDPSCFTTGPEKNPTLTAMAIAARAARRLAEDLA